MKEIKWDGKRIKTPGMYTDVPLDVYHSQLLCSGPSVSSSGLRRVLEENGGSPAHFWNEWSANPDAIEQDETRSLIIGRAAHHLMLSQTGFLSEFIVRPDELINPTTDKPRKWYHANAECKKWIADARETGRTIVTLDQLQDIKGMSERIRASEFRKILGGRVERSIIWQDERTGLWLKSRPDAIPADSAQFVDYKTCASVNYRAVMRSITEYAYHQQMALIRSAARSVLKIEPEDFVLVMQETSAPYCLRCVKLSDTDLDLGEKQNRHALDLIARCIKEKHWPGPGEDDIQRVNLQDWYRNSVSEGFERI